MAKESPEHVSIEVDDSGTIYYRFNAAHWQAIASNPANWEPTHAAARTSGLAPNAAAGAVRPQEVVQPRVADALLGNAPPQTHRVDIREPLPLDDEVSEGERARRTVR
jgi:hypothetical protein